MIGFNNFYRRRNTARIKKISYIKTGDYTSIIYNFINNKGLWETASLSIKGKLEFLKIGEIITEKEIFNYIIERGIKER